MQWFDWEFCRHIHWENMLNTHTRHIHTHTRSLVRYTYWHRYRSSWFCRMLAHRHDYTHIKRTTARAWNLNRQHHNNRFDYNTRARHDEKWGSLEYGLEKIAFPPPNIFIAKRNSCSGMCVVFFLYYMPMQEECFVPITMTMATAMTASNNLISFVTSKLTVDVYGHSQCKY